LVDRQFFLFRLQRREAFFNVAQYFLDFVNADDIFFHFREALVLFFVVHDRAGHFFEQSQSLRIRHGAQVLHFALLHNKVGIGFGKAGAFQEALNFVFRGAFALQKEFVLFQSDGAAQDDFVTILQRKAVVRIVKDDFDKGVDGGRARAFV
jgi:hypothetical protein